MSSYDMSKTIVFGIKNAISDAKLRKYLVLVLIISIIQQVIQNFVTYQFLRDFTGIFTGAVTAETMQLNINIIGISVIFGLVLLPVLVLIINRSLELKNRTHRDFSIGLSLHLIVIGILTLFSAILCIYNRKYLAMGIGAIVLIGLGMVLLPIVGIAAALLPLIGIILFVIYFVKVLVNGIRMGFAMTAYLEKDRSIMESIKYSWNISEKHVDTIFVTILLLIVLFVLISILFSIPSATYSTMAILTISTSASSIESMAALFIDPIYNITLFISLIPTAWLIISEYLIIVCMFDAFAKEKQETTNPAKTTVESTNSFTEEISNN